MNKTIEEQIFDDVTNMYHYFKHRDKLRYKWHLTKLELDLDTYYDIMKKDHPERDKIMDYYHKMWEF